MNRRLTLMLALAATVIGGALLAWQYGLAARDAARHPQATGTEPAERLPDFSLIDANGKRWSSTGRSGQVLLVNFWATWCQHCVKEIDTLNAIQHEFHDRGLRVIGISLDAPEAIAKFAARHAVDYPLLVADASAMRLSRQLGNAVQGVPYTVVFDRQGQRAFSQLGEIDSTDLRTRLKHLLD